ncbi:MoaF-related domain-containing protein [Methylophilus sp. 'Pure River']|uniref:MoaF-related domain-containing protein n=1 Tax=Methylophilus sp. 'Pure River' TaxID=3377117 RepID=UPI00398E54F4
MLVTASHPTMSTLKVLKRSIPFLTGWIFLGLVALGYFNKNGLQYVEKRTPVNEAYIGQFIYQYEDGSFYRVLVKDNQSMTWTCVTGPEKGASGTEHPDRLKIADKIYFATWVEETGINVTQVINLNTMKVYSTIIDGKQRYVISGNIVREK